MPSLSMNESLQLMICLDSWMVCCLPLSALPSLRCKTRCIVGITVTQWFAYGPDSTVIFCAVNFPQSWHDGSITANVLPCIHKKIGTYKMCVDQGLPRAVMLLMFLLDPLVTHKPINLLLICICTCYIYLTFLVLYAKQVNEV